MERLVTALIAAASIAVAPQAFSQVASHAALDISVTELDAVIKGVSAKKQVLGKTIYNEASEKVGSVQDLIMTSENVISFTIIGAGGFVGVGRHSVVIPVSQFKYDQGKIVPPGATKDATKALPEFRYECQQKPTKT